MRRWTMSAVGVVVLAVMLAGCGGGGSKKSSASPATQATQTTQTTQTQNTVPPTTATQTTSGTPNFATSGNCRDLATSAQKFSAALTGASGDIKKQADIFQKFADKAPSDIRADVKTIADAFSKIAASGVTLKTGQVPSSDQLAKLQAAIKQIDQAKVTAASQRISAWVQKNCTS
jgi:hypothetical protein